MLPLFASPWAFAALAALPTLAALYWLRNSYRQVHVSSLMLWLDAIESRASGLKIKRLRTPLLFFLELAILALLALAATGPRIELASARPPLVIVLDDTFSMLAGGEQSPRLKAIAALQDDIAWGGSVRFVVAGAKPQALGSIVTSWTEARELLTDWRCQSPTTSLLEAIALANELGGDRSRVLVVSDRGPPRDLEPGRVLWRGFGEPRPNQAILRASRWRRDADDRCALGLANFSDNFKDLVLVVETLNPEQEVYRETISMKPRETRQIAFQLRGNAGPVRARLVASDALDLDNQAFLVADETPAIRVDLRFKDDGMRDLFAKAFDATGKVLPPGAKPQIVVTDDVEMPAADAETWIVQVLQEKDADAFVGPFVLDRTHPLTEGLNLGGVVWGAGKSTEFAGGPVVMAGNVPLITDAEFAGGQHRVRIRLRPDLSTLPQTPNWPVLMWNLIAWRGRELPGLKRVNLTLGESALLTTRSPGESVVVTGPDGDSRTLPPRGSRLVIPAAGVGVYDVQHAGDRMKFAVSSLSAEESDLKDAATGQWGEWAEVSETIPGVYPFGWLLLLLALAILVAHQALAWRLK